jgi:hypothetical protein
MAVVVPELSELFEEAYERAGLEMRSGYDLKTARRSLNIMTLEWPEPVYHRSWDFASGCGYSNLHFAVGYY